MSPIYRPELFLLQLSLTVMARGPLADISLSLFLPGVGNFLTQIQEAAGLV